MQRLLTSLEQPDNDELLAKRRRLSAIISETGSAEESNQFRLTLHLVEMTRQDCLGLNLCARSYASVPVCTILTIVYTSLL